MNRKNPWRGFLQGERNALSEIFLTYHDDLFRYGLKLAGNEETVKDCIQELFLKLWKNRDNLKPVQNIKPYLLKSLRNHIIDSMELQKQNASLDSEIESALSMSYTEEDFATGNNVPEETRLKVIQALNKLTPRQREIIYLRYFEELDFNIISQVMGINIQSIRNVIHRGMQLLRDHMLILTFLLWISGDPVLSF
ncbi:MAG: sigma-70 family RNA polymerase sigma factor [Bacteroidales bacterium]|nr:sigma-70 family RNA polymerase sigma factor [Bacteroidales bacterium]